MEIELHVDMTVSEKTVMGRFTKKEVVAIVIELLLVFLFELWLFKLGLHVIVSFYIGLPIMIVLVGITLFRKADLTCIDMFCRMLQMRHSISYVSTEDPDEYLEKEKKNEGRKKWFLV